MVRNWIKNLKHSLWDLSLSWGGGQVLRMAASAYLTSPGGGPSISSEQNDEGRDPPHGMHDDYSIYRIQMLERRGHVPK